MVEFKRKKLELVSELKVVALYKDYLETPDGNTVVYDYIAHKKGGGAGVLLVDEEECTYLVRQFRNSINGVDIEIPAGGYAFPGEEGEVCARREAEEETGFIPGRMYHVSNMVSSIGTFDEKTDVFIGTKLKRGSVNLDPTEFVEILHISVDEAIDMVFKGEIIDSKTVTALFAYKHMKNSGIIQ